MELVDAASLTLLVATAYAVAGLALQHGAYILQYGSVFEPFRRWLEETACAPDSPRLARWLCARTRELLACQLCSITQLAIWFCAVPLTAMAAWWGGARPFGMAPALALVAYAVLGLGIAFSTAAVGLICWDLARFVGRASDALVLYIRAKKDAAEAEARRHRNAPALFPPLPGQRPAVRPEGRILRTAGSRERA